MKYIKLIFIVLYMSLFASISYGAQDCSNLKTFSHKWIKCKAGQGGGEDISSSNTSSESSESSGEKKLSLWGKWRAWNEKNSTLSDMKKD